MTIIRFPVERTPKGKTQAAWDQYQEELVKWRTENGVDSDPAKCKHPTLMGMDGHCVYCDTQVHTFDKEEIVT
jgi:hypothetical protein